MLCNGFHVSGSDLCRVKPFPMKTFLRLSILVGFTLAIPGVSCYSQPVNIGGKYGGGIIFYIDGTGQHGLIAAASDQSSATQWGCYGNAVGGTHGAIGNGKPNTTGIVNSCSEEGNAAFICRNLALNDFSDWFLPSKSELDQMFLKKAVIGGFADNEYWSSTEYDIYTAWIQDFTNGKQERSAKKNSKNVRAIRAF
jgi:hypothetical protein